MRLGRSYRYCIIALIATVIFYYAPFYIRYTYYGMIDSTGSNDAQRLTSIYLKDLKKLLDPYAIGSPVKVLDVYQTIGDESQYPCVPLKTSIGTTPICIYPPSLDGVISREIYSFGVWEPDIVREFESILAEDKSLQFIDLGANIGVYSLTALKHGRKVVSVDANPVNGMHLRQSIKLGNYESQSTIVINAVTDTHDPVALELPETRNVGGAVVNKSNIDSTIAISADAIFMDDLVDVVNFDRAVLKIDIELSEYAALSKSEKFFQRVDIPYIFMEFRSRTLNPKTVLENMGYRPYKSTDRTKRQSTNVNLWGDNVLWIRI